MIKTVSREEFLKEYSTIDGPIDVGADDYEAWVAAQQLGTLAIDSIKAIPDAYLQVMSKTDEEPK